MVTMTCCGGTYGNVFETTDHVCPIVQPSKPQMTLKALIALVSLSALLWGLIGGGLTALVAQQEEDELFFNCYISGDGDCGPTETWHGFINLF